VGAGARNARGDGVTIPGGITGLSGKHGGVTNATRVAGALTDGPKE